MFALSICKLMKARKRVCDVSLGYVVASCLAPDRVPDAQRAEDGGGSPAALRHGLLVLPVAEIDVHHPHGFQRSPSFVGGEVQACGLEFFSSARFSKKAREMMNARFPPVTAYRDKGGAFRSHFSSPEKARSTSLRSL